MKKIIAFSNQKGGVGKTTCTREIGILAAESGFRTLLIDCDSQANLSRSLVEDPGFGLYEALTGSDYEPEEVKPNLYLLSGGVKLAGLEKTLIGEVDAFTKLKELLEDEQFRKYDFIFLDSPPSLGVLTANALTAADHFIIPMNPSLYSMQGTNDLMATVSKVRKNFNPGLNLLGVIINSYDPAPVISRQIHDEIRLSFGDKVFCTAISRSIRIEEAIASKSGVISRPRIDGRQNKAAEEIRNLGDEFLTRLNPD